jgi:hypothetical protein
MVNAVSPLSHINLLFALLRRWFGLWRQGRPSPRLIATLELTEATLAAAIRATLTEDGVAFPELDDPAFLKWFAKNCPGADDHTETSPRPRHAPPGYLPIWSSARTVNAPRLDRRLPAGQGHADQCCANRMPAIHDARAPP